MNRETPALSERLEFPFPLREVHAGIPLANGVFGALIWGGEGELRITLNRADYWDHRGGLEFTEEATYANLRQWLEEGNEARLREVFEGRREAAPGVPPRPTRLPMGRVDLGLPPNWDVISGGLYLKTSEAEIEVARRIRPGLRAATGPRRPGEEARVRAILLRDTPVLCLRVTGLDSDELAFHGRPPESREVLAQFQQYGIPAAQPFDFEEMAGWVQECPGEPALCVAWMRTRSAGGVLIYVTSVYGATPVEARRTALQTLEAVRGEGFTPASVRTQGWWRRWWDQAAEVNLPDPTLELLYRLGMYKLGGLSTPGGVAATLQGAWVEEHRFPPWSGDYHFNINVQECYWPCFAGNHVEAMEPLVAMLQEWTPRLRESARCFVGVPDGRMLPHATDDRGLAMSGFWTGFVDHGSTAWVGQLLWLQYRYTMDREFLRRVAYPYLKGAMSVYEVMLEGDGEALALPVGVSPEFGGSGFGAWGRNASFQLAALHFLCRALIQASEELGVDYDRRQVWLEIERRLPIGAIGEGPELLLWEGQPLTESHRHHSHLAAIYPFDLLDPQSDRHRALVRNSMRRLTRMGMGLWTGWCLPWASILWARMGNGDMASLLLEVFRRFFMGPGYASTHDARQPGITVFDGRPDVMQVEAAEAAAAAVLEMLVHTCGGTLRVFPAVPTGWTGASFERVRAEGAFLVSGEWEAGRALRVQIRSEAGALLRLANPWGDDGVRLTRGTQTPVPIHRRILEIPTVAGEHLEFTPLL